MSTNNIPPSFEVLGTCAVPDYDSNGIYLRHKRTGLEVFHLLNDDDENLFGFTFRTLPHDSGGAPHILEHSVLCGSKNFPLRDPFIRLANQSVKTFLNAMTYPDCTIYPASSMVKADYYNLFSVYGDAVFFPLLEEWTFLQEGHRLERSAKNGATIQGVVYNEMKGAYSDFDGFAFDCVTRTLLPDSVYAVDSGGDPEKIPFFTYEQFKAFHKEFYRADNCLLFLSGNIPTSEQLQFIEEKFLDFLPDSASRSNLITIADVKPFSKAIDFIDFVGPAGTEKNSSATMNWITGISHNNTDYMTSIFLAEYLMGNDAAPLTKALLDSKLGEDLSPLCGASGEIKYLLLSAGLRGVKKRNEKKVCECIMDTLHSICAKQNPNDVESAVVSIDFNIREIKRSHGPFSINLLRRAVRSWLHHEDPAVCLSARNAFAIVKRNIQNDEKYISKTIEKMLLKNEHRAFIAVRPGKSYLNLREKSEQKIIDTLLKESAQDTVSPNVQKDDLSGDAIIPHLEPKELNVKPATSKTALDFIANGVPLYHTTETLNGLIYAEIAFPLDAESALSREDLALLPFFSDAITNVGFAGKSWSECALDIALSSGGFSANLFTASTPESVRENFMQSAGNNATAEFEKSLLGRSWIFFRIKTMTEKAERAFELLAQLLNSADFNDSERIKMLAFESKNDLASSIIPSGYEYARSRIAANFSASCAIDEIWNGISQYWTMEKITKQITDKKNSDIAHNFLRIKNALLQSGCVIHIAHDASDEKVLKLADTFVSACGVSAPKKAMAHNVSQLLPLCNSFWENTELKKNRLTEVFAMNGAMVGFASCGFPASSYGSAESVTEAVFSHWLSNTILWEKIRTVGGAYGAFASADSTEKVFSFATYRDPDPFRSLEVFPSCLESAAKTVFDKSSVEKAIAGAYSKEVQPRAPHARAFNAFIRRLYGLTEEQRVKKIEIMRETKISDMKNTAERLLALSKNENPSAVITGKKDAKNCKSKARICYMQ